MSDEMADLLELFRAESAEHIDLINSNLLLIEESAGMEDIHALFRSLHTIKGNAAMLGFDRIAELGHAGEHLVELLRSGRKKPEKRIIDLLFRLSDSMVELVAGREADDVARLVQELAQESQRVDEPSASRPTPSSAVPVEAIHAPAGAGDDGAEPAKPRKSLSMLIVEDDFVARKLLLNMLAPYGTCDIAKNGEEALVAFAMGLERTPYDIVFLDIMMPELDGFETVKRIRAMEMQQAVKSMQSLRDQRLHIREHAIVVMTSVLDDPEHLFNACYRCGADTYVVKPVERATVERIMRSFFI